MLPHGYREALAALLAHVRRYPLALLRQLVQQSVQQLLRGDLGKISWGIN